MKPVVDSTHKKVCNVRNTQMNTVAPLVSSTNTKVCAMQGEIATIKTDTLNLQRRLDDIDGCLQLIKVALNIVEPEPVVCAEITVVIL